MVEGYLPLAVIGSIALLGLLLNLWQLGVVKKMDREIRQLKQQVVSNVVESSEKPSFSTSLNRVEQEQKEIPVPRSSSEKYSYVASLASQGIDAQGMAKALQLAPAEVAQLMQLARLKQ